MSRSLTVVACAALLLPWLAACSKKPEEKKAAPPPTLITVTAVKSAAFEVTADTLGTLETIDDPRIAAEVAGRLVKVQVFAGQPVKRGAALAVIDATDLALQNRSEEAEVKRLEALLAQQERLVERQKNLASRSFISQNAVDDALAQRAALTAQLAAARAHADLGRRAVGKTTITAPFDGVVESQTVATGAYVKVGDPLFQLVSNRRLRAHLPFPETAAPQLARGQVVRLVSPQRPDKPIVSTIADIRPVIAAGSRALDIIVDIDNDGTLKSGGTVNAAVQIAAHASALTVPEQSVVLRPAGKVVYAIVEEAGQKKAQQRVVRVGAKKDGVSEILDGLAAGETVAVDGAGFLTHGATVAVKDAGKPAGGGAVAAAATKQ